MFHAFVQMPPNRLGTPHRIKRTPRSSRGRFILRLHLLIGTGKSQKSRLPNPTKRRRTQKSLTFPDVISLESTLGNLPSTIKVSTSCTNPLMVSLAEFFLRLYRNSVSCSLQDPASQTPLFAVPSIREYFVDLDYVLNVISDGPTKSFAFRRLKYLSSKWSMYSLVNEYQELADMKVRDKLYAHATVSQPDVSP
jgi:AMP deaminase